MPDQLREPQEQAEKKARVIKALRSFGGDIANVNNTWLADYVDVLKADLAVADLSAVTDQQVKTALPSLTNAQATLAVKYCKVIAAYKSKLQADLDSGDIPPNSQGVV